MGIGDLATDLIGEALPPASAIERTERHPANRPGEGSARRRPASVKPDAEETINEAEEIPAHQIDDLV